MRALALAALLMAGQAQAQDMPPLVESPVLTMRGIYAGCALSAVRYTEIKARTRATIKLFLGEVDERCLTWTVIWYPALTGRPVQDMSEDQRQRFNTLRYRILDDFQDELSTLYGIQR